MKSFESFLSLQMEEFLAYRESQGYKVKTHKRHLQVFDHYLAESNMDPMQLGPAFFVQMRANIKMQSSSINAILSATRTFFQFMVRHGHYRENPLGDLPQLKKNAIVPYVFSPEQIDQLLEAMCNRFHKTKGYFLKDLAIYMALLLLARCGMRISEPLKLKRHHYRREDATIYIEATKFSKDRIIPVPREVVTQIDNYLSVRSGLIRNDHSPFLLIQGNQSPLSDYQVRRMFHIISKDIGLDQPRRVIGKVNFLQPTPHSLRHSFAVNTLLKIKERGEYPQHALPMLAAYMGHSEYKYTSVYLRVTDAIIRRQLVDFSLWQERKE